MKPIFVLLAFWLCCLPLYSQDARLLRVKSIYIVPNGDEGETRQFREKIPRELGWVISASRDSADALLLYHGVRHLESAYCDRNPDGYAMHHHKTVQIYSNTRRPELIWRYDRDVWFKIAGKAVGLIKRELGRIASAALPGR